MKNKMAGFYEEMGNNRVPTRGMEQDGWDFTRRCGITFFGFYLEMGSKMAGIFYQEMRSKMTGILPGDVEVMAGILPGDVVKDI
jgi:hypothetical protein